MTIRSTFRTMVLALIPDASIATGDVDQAITAAHLLFPGTYFIDEMDESVTFVADTYEYGLPSAFMTVHRVMYQSETSGLYTMRLQPGTDYVIELATDTTAQIRLSRSIGWTVGRKLRIDGQRLYVAPAADGDSIELHEGWLTQYVLGLLHSSRGGTGSDNAAWHRAEAVQCFARANDIADNIDNRAKPNAQIVPGKLL